MIEILLDIYSLVVTPILISILVLVFFWKEGGQ